MRRILETLVAFLAFALSAISIDMPKVPRVMKWNEHAFAKRTYGKIISGGDSVGDAILGMLRGFARTAQAVVDAALRWSGWAEAGLRAGRAALFLPPEVKTRYNDYVKLTEEVVALRKEWSGKPMPQNIGEDVDKKLVEAKAIWEGDPADEKDKGIGKFVEAAEAELKIDDELSDIMRKRQRFDHVSQIVPSPTMPAEPKDSGKAIAGYMTLGEWVVLQKAVQNASRSGSWPVLTFSEIPATLMYSKGRNGRRGLDTPIIPITREQKAAVLELIEQKAVPTLTSVVQDDRLDVLVASTADDRLRLRDVLTIGQTTSDVVSYLRRTAQTRAAAETADGSAKPEGTFTWAEATANVRTIPAWMPVLTSQLADWPQLRQIIDDWLTYDVRRHEENQILYGDGTGQNLEGILTVSSPNAAQNIASHSLYVSGNDRLEHIRLGIAAIYTAGYEANAMLIHPEDWFSVVVLKGSDKHYLGQVFMTADRAPRVWGISVVEAEACQEESGLTTPARNLVIGDWRRGCALIERMGLSVQIGLNSDDFTKNKRTVLVEERVAFPIYAPQAFAFLQTRSEVT